MLFIIILFLNSCLNFYCNSFFKIHQLPDFYKESYFIDNFLVSQNLAKILIFKSYFFYSKECFKNSILVIDNLLETFPYDSNVLYLCYLKCMCYYSYLKHYKMNKFFFSYSKFLMTLFINYFYYSIYACKLKKRVGFLNNTFVYYDVSIYKNHIFYKKYISSINKLKKIINSYKINLHTSFFLYIIIKMYYSLNRKYISFKYFYFFINNFERNFFLKKLYYTFYF